MKKCNHCKIEKDLECFCKNKRQPDGYDKRCKDCAKIFSLNYKNKIKETPLIKKCSLCEMEKSSNEFHKKCSTKDGLHHICKTCRISLTKEYNDNNKEKVRETSQNWRKANPDYYKNKRLNRDDLKYQNRLNKCIETHGSTYDYSKTNFKVENIGKEKSIITCKIHGDFLQCLWAHIKGSGCQKCGIEKVKVANTLNSSGWTKSNWKRWGEKSTNFDNFKLYIIKCWNDTESFYKIGRTYKKIEKRFSSTDSMPYAYELIYSVVSDAETIYDLELSLKNTHREYAYKPNIYFKGETECYTYINKELIK